MSLRIIDDSNVRQAALVDKTADDASRKLTAFIGQSAKVAASLGVMSDRLGSIAVAILTYRNSANRTAGAAGSC